jgi:CRISPR/Cas system CMR subunit Cmr6 (Cas7 group RAMP superfamily)
VIGTANDVKDFCKVLKAAVYDLGLGGKTAAGYGYCTVTDAP